MSRIEIDMIVNSRDLPSQGLHVSMKELVGSSPIGVVYTISGGPSLGKSTNHSKKAHAQVAKNDSKAIPVRPETFKVCVDLGRK